MSNEHNKAPACEAVGKFIEQANALLSLDAENALAPHGIGGFARALLTDAIKLLSNPPAEASAPAVPQGWKSVLIPTEWTIGPNLFKDWCNQWFGPDADDEYLMRAAHALLGLAATPAAPSQEPVTLADDDIARCINVATCGRPFIGLMNPGGVPSAFSRSLADLLIAALREKGGV